MNEIRECSHTETKRVTVNPFQSRKGRRKDIESAVDNQWLLILLVPEFPFSGLFPNAYKRVPQGVSGANRLSAIHRPHRHPTSKAPSRHNSCILMDFYLLDG